MTEHDVPVTAHRRRIGPVSTACRLALTDVTAWSAVNWTSAGIGWFSRTSTIADPGIWLLIGLATTRTPRPPCPLRPAPR
jgi:hypothetical protein